MILPTSEADFAAGLERGQEALWNNGYPGRWLAMGRGEGDHENTLYVAYSFGGRSDSSKNRVAVLEDNAVRLIAPGMTSEEMDEIPDAPLIYYHAIDSEDGVFVVSNGGQTRPVLDAVTNGVLLKHAVTNAPTVPGTMHGQEIEIDLSSYEPDEPINTPRITGAIDLHPKAVAPFGLAVVRKDLLTGEPIRTFYTAGIEDIQPGHGWAVQTYGWNDPSDRETPVPSFDQAPYGFSMKGDMAAIASRIQEAIGKRTFAAAVVRAVDIGRREFKGHTFINTRG